MTDPTTLIRLQRRPAARKGLGLKTPNVADKRQASVPD